MVQATLNTTISEDPIEVLFSGFTGKQIVGFLSARGVLGSFQKNSVSPGTPIPLWKQYTGPGSPEL